MTKQNLHLMIIYQRYSKKNEIQIDSMNFTSNIVEVVRIDVEFVRFQLFAMLIARFLLNKIFRKRKRNR